MLGSEFAGTVHATGDDVTGLRVGEDVFGITGLRFGAHAEYVQIDADAAVAPMPQSLTYERATAVLDGALDALGKLRRVRTREGQRVLVYGASGSIGTASVQLAKARGAWVAAVGPTQHLDLLRSLGADRVIDYTREDFVNSGERYDAIVDAVGKLPFARCRHLLVPGGFYTFADGWSNLPWILLSTLRLAGGRRAVFAPPRHSKVDVEYLRDLIEAGDYQPVVDRVYRFEDIIDAARYVETGQKAGNVALTLA